MVITNTDFIRDAVLFTRNALRTNITDPLGGRATSKFVMTKYPSKTVEYPVITVMDNGGDETALSGQQSEALFMNIELEIRVWATSQKQKNQLTSQIINFLRGNQLGVGGSIEFGLFDYKLVSTVPVDEDGSKGIKSKVITISYNLELN